MLAIGGFSMIGIAPLVSAIIALLVLKVKVKETTEFAKYLPYYVRMAPRIQRSHSFLVDPIY